MLVVKRAGVCALRARLAKNVIPFRTQKPSPLGGRMSDLECRGRFAWAWTKHDTGNATEGDGAEQRPAIEFSSHGAITASGRLNGRWLRALNHTPDALAEADADGAFTFAPGAHCNFVAVFKEVSPLTAFKFDRLLPPTADLEQ